jgi:hypothetical protein
MSSKIPNSESENIDNEKSEESIIDQSESQSRELPYNSLSSARIQEKYEDKIEKINHVLSSMLETGIRLETQIDEIKSTLTNNKNADKNKLKRINDLSEQRDRIEKMFNKIISEIRQVPVKSGGKNKTYNKKRSKHNKTKKQ